MKKIIAKVLTGCFLLAVSMSCGDNNNQSEGAADSDDTENAAASPATQNATSASTDTTATDTVVKGNNPKPGEGNYTSGTGVKSGIER